MSLAQSEEGWLEITLGTKVDIDIEPPCRVSAYSWPTWNSLHRPRWLQSHHLPFSTSQVLELRCKPPCPAYLAFVTSHSSGEEAKGDLELLNLLSLPTKGWGHGDATSPGFYGCSCHLQCFNFYVVKSIIIFDRSVLVTIVRRPCFMIHF